MVNKITKTAETENSPVRANRVSKAHIIQQYMENYGARYGLRELAAALGKPHQTIKPYVARLVCENVLLRQKRGKRADYVLNMLESRAYDYLVLAEKERLLDRLSRDTLLKVLVGKLSGFFSETIFVIFGSFAKGTKAGDIDMLATGREHFKHEIKNFEQVYNKEVHLIYAKNLKTLDMPLIKEVYKNHLVLNGTESIVRWFGELYGQNKLV
ncbi:MAG: hypothetical protein V1839_00205 [archaeon]